MLSVNKLESLIELFDFKKIETGLPKSVKKSKNSYKENIFTHLHTILNSDNDKYHMLELIFNSEIIIIFEYKRVVAPSQLNIISGVKSMVNRKRLVMCDNNDFYSSTKVLNEICSEYNHIIRKNKIKKILNNEHENL